MKKILVMSKGQIQEEKVSDFCVVNYYDSTAKTLAEIQDISIAKNTTILQLEKENKLLSLEVNDVEVTEKTKKIEKKREKTAIPLKLMTEDVALSIIDFIEKNKESDFIFQCDFGRSRSLTTAYFANRFLLLDHELINKEVLIRNKSIFKILFNAYLFPKKRK